MSSINGTVEITAEAWATMVSHAETTYPNECCGVMLGHAEPGHKRVTVAAPLQNSWQGAQHDRYEIRPQDLLAADAEARRRGLDVIGIFHSHPDCDAFFSDTDLRNSCPWYSFVVLSVRHGRYAQARSFLPDLDQTLALEEELLCPPS